MPDDFTHQERRLGPEWVKLNGLWLIHTTDPLHVKTDHFKNNFEVLMFIRSNNLCQFLSLKAFSHQQGNKRKSSIINAHDEIHYQADWSFISGFLFIFLHDFLVKTKQFLNPLSSCQRRFVMRRPMDTRGKREMVRIMFKGQFIDQDLHRASSLLITVHKRLLNGGVVTKMQINFTSGDTVRGFLYILALE